MERARPAVDDSSADAGSFHPSSGLICAACGYNMAPVTMFTQVSRLLAFWQMSDN
jgi:hypothetical protein